MQKKEQIISKEILVQDLKKVMQKYQEEFPNSKQIITREYYRKKGKYSIEYEQIFGSFDNFKNQLENEINTIELEKRFKILTDQIASLKKDKEKLLRNEIRNEQYLEEFKTKLYPIKSNVKIPKIVNLSREKEIVLILSDWHLGETIVSEELYGINNFNKEVLFKRADQIFEQFHKHCKNIKVNNIRIYLLGDLLSGNIHDEL